MCLLFCNQYLYADRHEENANNTIYAAGVSVSAGGQAILSVCMKNDVDIAGFEFEIDLPKGVTVNHTTDEFGTMSATAALSTKRTSTARHTFSAVFTDESNYSHVKVLCYSNTALSFTGNDGEIATFTLDIDPSLENGDYEINFNRIVISNATDTYATENVKSVLSVEEIAPNYNEEYAVTIAPFTVDANKDYDKDIENTTDNKIVVFKMKNSSVVSKVEFDVELAEGIRFGQYSQQVNVGTNKKPIWETKYYDDPYFAGDYVSEDDFPEVDDNEDGSKHFIAENDFKVTDNCADIIKIAITTEELEEGVYPILIKNIVVTLADETPISNIAPYSTEIYVGSPKATPTNGVVTFSGDYSDEDMAVMMLSAIPTGDATVATVDLSGVTALPAGKKITTANPNALIVTSTNLGLANKENVVIGNTCENLALTDKNDFVTDKKFTAINATYTREMSNKWGTICLPYAVQSNEQIAYYNIVGVENDILILEKYDILPANTPALVQKASGNTIVCEANNVKVGGLISDVTGNVTMKGSFANETMVTDENAYYIANNRFWLNNQYFFVDAFRAYFTVSSSIAKANVFNIDDIVTQIDALTNGNDIIGIWNANGTTRENIDKGMNIIKTSDGRIFKVLVK